jgi:CRP-like cAMP-binding protein
MKQEHLAQIAGCAANVRYDAGAFPGRAGDPADKFWVIRQGSMALEIHAPGRGAITVETMGEGEVVGFSWLLPPHQLRFDIHVLAATRALMFDGRCLRGKCLVDPPLGYELLGRFSRLMAQRMEAMSLQLLDVYGDHYADHD